MAISATQSVVGLPRFRHGHAVATTKTPEYRAWQDAKARCHNPKCPSYANYGARGIAMCARWLHSFASFLADVGPRPSDRHSLDRIDNDGNYEPGNCRWSTATQQLRNTRRTLWTEYEGRAVTIAELSQRFGIVGNVISHRLRAGWSVEKSISTPVGGRRLVLVNGVARRIGDVAAEVGISTGTLSYRLDRGWTVDEALSIRPRLGNRVPSKVAL